MSDIRQKITEEMKLHEEWYKARPSVPELDAFMRKLCEDYEHDYGTICHAVAAAGLAAMRAVVASPAGGISGFQAGCILWELIRRWGHVEGPARLVRYEEMLYPQYADRFAKVIDAHTWKWLQEQARVKLAESSVMAAHVREHMESIVAGVVPFGYVVGAE